MLNQSGTSSANTAATTSSSSRRRRQLSPRGRELLVRASVSAAVTNADHSQVSCKRQCALQLRCSGPRNGACEALSSAATRALSTAALKFERPDLRARLLERCDCTPPHRGKGRRPARSQRIPACSKNKRTASMDSIRLGKINMYERELGLSRKEEVASNESMRHRLRGAPHVSPGVRQR